MESVYPTKDPYREKYRVFKCACKSKHIPICQEWLDSFESFKSFLIKVGWKKGMTLSRLNPKRPYSPKNCILMERGKALKLSGYSVKDLALKYNLNAGTVRQRISVYGWTLEDFEKGYKKNSYNPHDLSKHKRYFKDNLLATEIALKYKLSLSKTMGRLRIGWTERDFERGYRKYGKSKTYLCILNKRDFLYKSERFFYVKSHIPNLSEVEIQALGLLEKNHHIWLLINEGSPSGFIHFSVEKKNVNIQHCYGDVTFLFTLLRKRRPDHSFSLSISMKDYYFLFKETLFKKEKYL